MAYETGRKRKRGKGLRVWVSAGSSLNVRVYLQKPRRWHECGWEEVPDCVLCRKEASRIFPRLPCPYTNDLVEAILYAEEVQYGRRFVCRKK